MAPKMTEVKGSWVGTVQILGPFLTIDSHTKNNMEKSGPRLRDKAKDPLEGTSDVLLLRHSC